MLQFYGDILPDTGHYCLILLPEGTHLWADSLEQLTTLTERYEGRTGVYFGTAGFATPANRKQVNVASLKALRLDIDAGPEKLAKHGPEKVYATQQAALAASLDFFRSTGLKPSYVVSSGAGLHLYFCLADALAPNDWLRYAKGLSALGAKYEFKVDTSVTEDSARILRPPGALHNNGNRVAILKRTGVVYTTEALDALLPAPPKIRRYDTSINDAVTAFAADLRKYSAFKVVKHCGALGNFIQKDADVEEPYWRAMLGLVKLSVEGEAQAHQWSSLSPQYSWEETQKKLDLWVVGPPTCELMSTIYAGCKVCKHNGKVKTPLSLGLMSVDEIAAITPKEPEAQAEPDPAPWVEPEAQAEPDPAPWVEPEAQAEPEESVFGDAFGSDDFGDEEPAPRTAKAVEVESGNLKGPWDSVLPKGFKVIGTTKHPRLVQESEKDTVDADGKKMRIPCLIRVTDQMFWCGRSAGAAHSDDTAQVTINVQSKSEVTAYTTSQTSFASVADMQKYLSGKGIHPTDDPKAPIALMNYVRNQLTMLRETGKQRPKIADHLGLRIEGGQILAAHGKYVIYGDGTIQEAFLSPALRGVAAQFPIPLPASPTGEWGPEVWESHINPAATKHVEFLKKYYGAPGMERFQLAILMGLASPYMAFVTGQFHDGSTLPRLGLSVSLFSRESARGKTTAVMSAILAYGRPSDLTNDSGKRGATDNARISRLSLHGTMPNIMDEMGGASAASVAEVVSAVANGAAKQRSTREGGLNESSPWALINLMTTNTSQRDMIAAVQENSGAIQYRLLELNLDNSPEYSQELRDQFTDDWSKLNSECPGALGAVIHREIAKLSPANANKLVTACCKRAGDMVGADQTDRFQYRALGAVLALTLMLSKLGLCPFPLDGALEAFKAAHEQGKSFVAENVLPTDGLTLLSMALHDLYPYTLITDKLSKGRLQYDNSLNERTPDNVKARHVRSERTTFVTVAALREWAQLKSVSERDMILAGVREQAIRTVEEYGGLHPVSGERYRTTRTSTLKNLQAGIRGNTGVLVRCYEVNIAKLNGKLGVPPVEYDGFEDNIVPIHGASVAA